MKLLHITTKYVFDVSDMEPVRLSDFRRTLFQPETVTVSVRDTTGFHDVRAHGHKVRNSWKFGFRFEIADDKIVPDRRFGDAPDWVKAVVDRAWALDHEDVGGDVR